MNSSIIGPTSIRSMRLADGSSEVECLAVGCERGAGDARLGVERSQQFSIVGKQSSIPRSLGLAAGHEKGAAGGEAEGLHQPGAAITVADLADLLRWRGLPVPPLPHHLTIAGHRVGHLPHATTQE